MKKIYVPVIVILIALISSSAYVLQSSGMPGYSGSPGEATCNSCHGGGSSSASGTTITAIPQFSLNEYMPDSTYEITISTSASGFSRFGFACEILDSINKNAGTMFGAGAGVQFQNAFNARKNAVHIGAKIATLANFTFSWTAPSTGKVIFYSAVNAVNGNQNTNGDFPLAKTSLTLTAAAPITPSVPTTPDDSTLKGDVGISERIASALKAHIFPNPANEFTNLNYTLLQNTLVTAELVSIEGKEIKTLLNSRQTPGEHSQILDLTEIPAGIYFVRIRLNEQRVSQKLISVR